MIDLNEYKSSTIQLVKLINFEIMDRRNISLNDINFRKKNYKKIINLYRMIINLKKLMR